MSVKRRRCSSVGCLERIKVRSVMLIRIIIRMNLHFVLTAARRNHAANCFIDSSSKPSKPIPSHIGVSSAEKTIRMTPLRWSKVYTQISEKVVMTKNSRFLEKRPYLFASRKNAPESFVPRSACFAYLSQMPHFLGTGSRDGRSRFVSALGRIAFPC
jgi:hypothetical protein